MVSHTPMSSPYITPRKAAFAGAIRYYGCGRAACGQSWAELLHLVAGGEGSDRRGTFAPGANVSAIARSHRLDPSQLFSWRRKALASGLVAPVSGAGAQAVKFARFDAVTSDIVEIVIDDVVCVPAAMWRLGAACRGRPGGSAGMIPAGVQVYVASTPVDFRKGSTGLMALVRDCGADPFSGALCSVRKGRIGSRRFGGTAAGCACLPRRLRRRSSVGLRLRRPGCG
jgi:hypothetical protein